MAKTVFDVLLDRVNDDIDRSKDFLASGGPKDFTQYREAVGVVRGLETCKQYIVDLSRKYMEDDDD